jgi:limonene-1,2-epoxide hydrolase
MSMTEQERANEELVNQFCRDWSLRDAAHLTTYFSTPFEYMVWEGGPVITTTEEFIRQMGPFLKNLKLVDWEMIRSTAMGPMVINERVDHFYAHDSKYDNHPRIAGMFIVRNGKIAVWRDYSVNPKGSK